MFNSCAQNDSKNHLKNHFFTEETAETVINYILNEYKYGEPLTTHHKPNITTLFDQIICNADILKQYEDTYNIKYVITDKSLGPGIVDRDIHKSITINLIKEILVPINYIHNPAQIRDIAMEFIYKYNHILHDKGFTPNQSLIDIITDLHQTKSGYFKWNPLYKAHKFDEHNNHIPKLRPVISGNNSPLKPILKLISEACIIINHALQQLYNFTNIVQDSFHVIHLINDYIQNNFDPNDTIITFDFVSFYTEIPISFINEKLIFLQKLFIYKYKKEGAIKFLFYEQLILLIKDGYKIACKYCIIKINGKFYIQKQGVIMGADFAPNLANLSVLTHMIQTKIYKCIYIKLNIRMIDDTLMIFNSKNMNIHDIFTKFYPKILKFTSTQMTNNKIKFLDILLIKIRGTLQYIMQIKPLKVEFFVPFTSNHPKHIKINIVKNMTIRAAILCSNIVLFNHAIIALKLRFKQSGYPELFLHKYMNEISYKNRSNSINNLNHRRTNKIRFILNQNKLYYKPIWIPPEEKSIITIPYDTILYNMNRYNLIKQIIQKEHPNQRIVFKLNDSIQKVIRCKDANYDL